MIEFSRDAGTGGFETRPYIFCDAGTGGFEIRPYDSHDTHAVVLELESG